MENTRSEIVPMIARHALPLALLLSACAAEDRGAPTAGSGQPVDIRAAAAACGRTIPAAGTYLYRTSSEGDVQEERSAENPLMRRRSDGFTRVDPCGRVIERTGQNAVRFSPHNGQLPGVPMTLGHRWTQDYSSQSQRDPHQRRKTCNVAAAEDVTVPAGTFPSWRVECINQRLGVMHPINEVVSFRQGDLILLRYDGSSIGGIRNTIELLALPGNAGGR
ncbi:hypothetical protein [Sabulicella rubraurantiaca]|uniref:hypothetical protein n=1 Tax=Sabulicella rubraurantiaca TaxID=2811429 RepID=UPI001A96795C|nr:hypothetical protein [Sabulicella rubraurantiaca]